MTSFRFVEYKGIRKIHQYFEEYVPIITRNIAKSNVLKMYKSGKEKIICFLESVSGRIFLTSDLWTSITTDDYLCLMAYYIDKEWKL